MDPTITSAPAAASQPTATSAPPMPSPAPASAPAPSAPATTPAVQAKPSFADDMNRQIAALEAAPQTAAPVGQPAALPGAVQAPADGTVQTPQAAAVPTEDYSWAGHLAKHLGIQDQSLLADPKKFVGAVGDEFKNVVNLQRELADLKQKMPYYTAWQSGKLPAEAIPAAVPVAKPAEEALWNAPEYDPAWEHIITRDDTGNFVVPQGVDPSIIAKRQQFFEHRAKTINDFSKDPMAFMEKFSKPLIEAKAERIVEQKLAQMQEHQLAQKLAAENKSWMVERNTITGQEVWTEAGAEFMKVGAQLEKEFPGVPVARLNELAKKEAIVNIQMRRAQQAAAAAAPQAGQPVQAQPAAVNWQQPAPFAAPQPAVPANAFNTLGANPAAANGYTTKKDFGDFLKEQLAAQGQVV